MPSIQSINIDSHIYGRYGWCRRAKRYGWTPVFYFWDVLTVFSGSNRQTNEMLKRSKYRRLRSDSGASSSSPSSSSFSTKERSSKAPPLEDFNSRDALLVPQSLISATHGGAASFTRRSFSLQRATGSSHNPCRSPCTGQHTTDRVVHHDITVGRPHSHLVFGPLPKLSLLSLSFFFKNHPGITFQL